MEQGVYQDISDREYRKIKAVSNSYLGRIDKCPAGGKAPSKDTPSFAGGRAFHILTLEGLDAFRERFAVMPKTDKRTKAGKEAYAEFMEANKGLEHISAEDCITANEMTEAVLCHPIARGMLSGGQSEETVVWCDEETGILCKARPDKIPNKSKNIIVDLKSTTSADPRKFAYSCKDYGYIRQAGMYLEGKTLTASGSIVFDQFVFICCEKTPPYRVEIFIPERDYIKWGTYEFHRLLQKEEWLRKSKKYPNYSNDAIFTLEMPSCLNNELAQMEAE